MAIVIPADYLTEGADRQCLTLECPNFHGDQDALIEQVAAANPNTIVVLETGGPVLTPWRGKVRALLEAWYPRRAGRDGDSARALRRRRSGRTPARDVPRSRGRHPDRRRPVSTRASPTRATTRRECWSATAGTTQADSPRVPVRLRALLRELRLPRAAHTPGGRPGTGRDGERPGGQHGPPARHRRAPAVPRAAAALRGRRAAAGAAQGVPARDARARGEHAGHIPRSAGGLSYWKVGARGWWVAPGCYTVAVARSSRAAGPTERSHWAGQPAASARCGFPARAPPALAPGPGRRRPKTRKARDEGEPAGPWLVSGRWRGPATPSTSTTTSG